MLCLFYLCAWSSYQGTVSARSTTEPTSAETGGIGENLFSSSLNAVSFVGGPVLNTSLSLGFRLLPVFSPRLYLKSEVQEHVV